MQEEQYHCEKIDGMLDNLKSCLDLPVNFKPRSSDVAAARAQASMKRLN